MKKFLTVLFLLIFTGSAYGRDPSKEVISPLDITVKEFAPISQLIDEAKRNEDAKILFINFNSTISMFMGLRYLFSVYFQRTDEELECINEIEPDNIKLGYESGLFDGNEKMVRVYTQLMLECLTRENLLRIFNKDSENFNSFEELRAKHLQKENT